MALNLFISYSHKDERIKQKIQEHLASLRRSDLIADWCDRKIAPGSEWAGEIDARLREADVVLLLVSSAFIDSEYCYGIEMEQALRQHNSGDSVVVPISVRQCRWEGLPFAKLQALPKDKNPICNARPMDSALTEVAEGIARIANSLSPRQRDIFREETSRTSSFSQAFEGFLNDFGVEIRHPRKTDIYLDDLYIDPDLRLLDEENTGQLIISLEKFLESAEGKSIILGDEQIGLTSLAKRIVKAQSTRGKSCVYVDFSEVSSKNVGKIIAASARRQQSDGGDLPSHFDVLVIDNYGESPLNLRAKRSALQEFYEVANRVIILSSDHILYAHEEIELVEDFCHYQAAPFGHVKREELIKKWVRLGQDDTIADEEVHSEVDYFAQHIDAFVRRNVVPAKPIFLVSILQAMESVTPTKLQLTSYGHCYQHLIYQALAKGRVKAGAIDSYLNLLTQFAAAIFHSPNGALDADGTRAFCLQYQNNYLGIDAEPAIEHLVHCGLLKRDSGNQIGFRYKYIYYFFAGKYFAENISDASVKTQLVELLSQLHREDRANIVVFTTHHTRDPFLLEEIECAIMAQFDAEAPATLNNEELRFMGDFVESIPKLVMETRNVERERHRRNQALDELHEGPEDEKRANNQKGLEAGTQETSPEEMDLDGVLVRINTTVKGLEIIGQIIRNRHGSLKKSEIESIADSAILAGLQFLSFFLKIARTSREDIVQSIHDQITQDPSITDQEIEKEAKNIFLIMTYQAIYGLARKVALSIGCREAISVFRELHQKIRTPASTLIQTNIELCFEKSLDIERLRGLFRELEGNIACQRMFRESVLMHIYLHAVPYQTKGQISSHFDIPRKAQDQIDARRDTKLLRRRNRHY